MKYPITGMLGIAAFLLAAPLAANAADLAVKAPPPAPVVYDWTGFYLDVGAGWQYDQFNWTYTNFVPAQNPFSLSHGGGSITGHVGYQQQFGWVVVGGEIGAFRSMNGNAASIVSPGGGAVAGPCNNLGGYTCRASIDYATLAGGKLGVDWGNWLFYGVGGVAFNSNISTQAFLPSGLLSDVGGQQSAHGWYIGAGLDYLLLKTRFGDLITGVEYEHVSFGTVTQCTVPTPASAIVTGCPGTPAADARLISAKEDAVWGKLTLKFNPFN